MASFNRGVKHARVRVFKWNEELRNVDSSHGLFMYRVHDSTKGEEEIFHLSVFHLIHLTTQESTRWLVSQAIEGNGSFSDDTTAKLRKSVSDHLLSCFQFDPRTLSSLKKPTILIVVDVYVSKMTRNTRKRDLSSAFSSNEQVVEDLDDDNSVGSDSVKRRKVGDARVYKREIRSRLQRKLSDQDLFEMRGMLRSRLKETMALWIKPIVTGEPTGLNRVEAAVKVKEFDGREPVDVCSICLDGVSRGMAVARTPCSHTFHRDCLFQWLPNTSSCPLCRSLCATLI